MTNEQILEIAEKHFDYQGGWLANTEDLLKFARELCDKGQEEEIRSLSDPNQRILHQSKQLAAYMERQSQPLWHRIGGNTGPYDLGPAEIANILNLIADEVEHRGVIDYDRDPGETAEWLRHEAQKAVSDIES